jgi:hypothetical protein
MRTGIVLSLTISLGVAALAVAAPRPAGPAAQRDKSQRPSPPAHAECKFTSGATITVDYSTPSMKGRKILGELVPYGKVWRAGANEATTFVVSKPVRVGNLDVPPGGYTMFVIPEQGKPWTLIISKKTGEWGIPYPGEQYDLGRTPMAGSVLSSPVEKFTIGFTHGSDDTCLMHMEWETTSASVKIQEKK